MFRSFTRLALALTLVVSVGGRLAVADETNFFTSAAMDLTWNDGTNGGDRTWNWTGTGDSTTYNPPDGSWNIPQTGVFSWQNVHFDADPMISGAFSVTNNTAVTQTFTLNISMPTVFVAGSTTIFGSSSISINDANSSTSASMGTSGGTSIYRAKVDGSVVKTLFDAPYSLSSGFPFPITASDSMSYAFLPGPAGVAVDIGIDHTFTLSPGDIATVNSTFVIIPEPATLSLLAFGVVALIRRKSR